MNTFNNTIFTLTLSNGEKYKAWGLGGIAIFREHLRFLTIAKIQEEPSPLNGCRFLYVSRPPEADKDILAAFGEVRMNVVFAQQVKQQLCHKTWGVRAFYEWLTPEEIGQEMGGN